MSSTLTRLKAATIIFAATTFSMAAEATVSQALVIQINEDSQYAFSADEFKSAHAIQDFDKVVITRLASAGSLTLKGAPVKMDQSIAANDLGKLTYQPKANDFGKNYATFKYKLVGAGTDNSEYTTVINVAPVNDKPTVKDVIFTVTEQSHTVTGGPIEVKDVSNERNEDTYKYELVYAPGSDHAQFSDLFEINKLSNQNAIIKVRPNAKLDYATKSTYVVYAAVTDDAATETEVVNGPQTSKPFKITVNVKNENDAPTISNQAFTIPEKNKTAKGIEDWTSDKEVAQVTADDADGDNLTYKVESSGIPFAFMNGTKTLIVSDGSKLDYETKSVWTFKVSATDPSGASTSANITVNLEDVNESPIPADVKSEYTVKENTATGTSFGSFTVTDNDDGDKLTYSLAGALTGAAGISGTLKGKTLADIFYVDEPANSRGKRNASIRVRSSALLDFEELYKSSTKNASYPMTITITDMGSNSVTVTTKITVQDVNEDLTATGDTFYIQEHSPGLTHVCTTEYDEDCSASDYGYVTGTDKDKYNKSFSTLTYSMSTANTGTNVTDAKSFVVNPNDGSISTAATAEFEYDGDDAKISYTFLVNVSDGTFSKDVSVTVKVLNIDEPPINLVTEGSGRIREDATKGTNAASFSKEFITDPEELAKFEALGDDVRFTISETASGYGVFKPNIETGEINLLDPSKIDFETLCAKDSSCRVNGTSPMYTVEMTASNADESVTLNIIRNIEIVDVNEPPTASDFTKTVDENIAGGSSIGFISASDPDVYASCKTINNPDGTSTIHHSCGFNTLHYSIVDASGLPFEIDQTTGEIKLKKNERLRYIEKTQYKFDVKVSDRATSEPALSTIAHATINVKDVYEPSEFKVLADLYEVKENTDVGTKFGDKIVVYDEDAADVSTTAKPALTIAIKDNGTCTAGKTCAEDLFNVVIVKNTDANHETQFQFVVKSDLNYEDLYKATDEDAIFDVTLTITDNGGNKVSQDTKIRVIDENEEPRFDNRSYSFEIAENVAKETSLGIAKATDPDIWNKNFGTLHFSLEGDDAAFFDINRRTGEISTINNAKLDYEGKNKYEFYAVVTDGEFTISDPITVNVTNDKESPEFLNVPEIAINENTLEDARVGVVSAHDDDCKNNNTCKKPTYTLAATDIDADDYKSFKIDKTTGTIKVAKDSILNYEVQDEYYVRVVVTDGDDPTIASYVDVTIKINDVNDAPTYGKKEYVFNVHENAPVGEFVGSVEAEDEDSWNKFTYALSDYETNSRDSEVFSIDEDGRIFVKSALNYEKKPQYQIWAKVTDNGEDKGFRNYTATTLVTINLIDDQDAPTIVDDGKDLYIDENTIESPNNTPNKFIITLFEATDDDPGQTATLESYMTDAGNTGADTIFEIKTERTDTLYGIYLVVKDNSSFNYETLPNVHKVNIFVTDEDGLETKLTKTIRIRDINEKPTITAAEFNVDENSKEGTVIGTIKATDPDANSKFTFTLTKENPYVTISTNGDIKVKKGAVIDYEKIKDFTIKVKVTDAGGLSDEKEFKITVNDIKNENTAIKVARDIHLNFIDGTLTTNKAGYVQVKFFDMLGHQAASIEKYVSAGTSNISIENEKISAGVYLVQVKFNGLQLQKATKVKLSR